MKKNIFVVSTMLVTQFVYGFFPATNSNFQRSLDRTYYVWDTRDTDFFNANKEYGIDDFVTIPYCMKKSQECPMKSSEYLLQNYENFAKNHLSKAKKLIQSVCLDTKEIKEQIESTLEMAGVDSFQINKVVEANIGAQLKKYCENPSASFDALKKAVTWEAIKQYSDDSMVVLNPDTLVWLEENFDQQEVPSITRDAFDGPSGYGPNRTVMVRITNAAHRVGSFLRDALIYQEAYKRYKAVVSGAVIESPGSYRVFKQKHIDVSYAFIKDQGQLDLRKCPRFFNSIVNPEGIFFDPKDAESLIKYKASAQEIALPLDAAIIEKVRETSISCSIKVPFPGLYQYDEQGKALVVKKTKEALEQAIKAIYSK